MKPVSATLKHTPYMRYFSVILLAFGLLGTAPLQAQTFSLQECQDMAVANNRSLANTRTDMAMAAEDEAMAFTKFFPSVSAGATGFIAAKDLIRTERDLSGLAAAYGPALGQLGMAIPESYAVSMMKKGAVADVMATQPLYAGGQIRTGRKLAALQHEVRRLQVNMEERDLLQHVAEYYWQICALRANAATVDTVLAQLRGVHRYTENYVKAGITHRNALLQIEMKQQEMESSRLQLDNADALLRMVLAQLCGMKPQGFDVRPEATRPEDCPKPATLFIAPADAVENRVELALAERNVRAQQLQERMERGKLLPTVAIGAAGIYQDMALGDGMDNMKNGNLIGFATVSIPITDWWGGKHTLRKAQLQRQKAENSRDEAREQLEIDILSAWNNLTEGYAQIEVARRSITSADENLRLTTDEYRAGTIDITDMLDAITLYTQAHNRMTEAVANYQTRMADYLQKTR